MFQNKRRPWKTLLIALTMVMAVSVISGCGNNKVVATYEGGEITQKEYEAEQQVMVFLQPQYSQFLELEDFRNYVAKQAVAYEYLEAQASEDIKKVGKEKATEQVTDMEQSIGADQYKERLKQTDLTAKDIENYMIRLYTVVESEKAKVTEEDVKNEFAATKDDYTTASVRHILIGLEDLEGKERTKEEALKIANEVKAKLDQGEDFAELAKQYSTDPGSKDNGGLYEDTSVSGWVTQFKEKAISLPLNTISDPVETDFGYHIMRVEKRTEKSYETLTDNDKELVKLSVAYQKLDEFMAGDLESKVLKDVTLPKLKKK